MSPCDSAMSSQHSSMVLSILSMWSVASSWLLAVLRYGASLTANVLCLSESTLMIFRPVSHLMRSCNLIASVSDSFSFFTLCSGSPFLKCSADVSILLSISSLKIDSPGRYMPADHHKVGCNSVTFCTFNLFLFVHSNF